MSTPIITNNNFTVTKTATPTAGTATSSSSSAAASLASSQDTFLKLLVTQMQNQDPLNPMDNSQMTSQIAQLNTVQGINQLNATVNGLQAQMQASQNLQATNFLGSTVMAPGSNLNVAADANGKAIVPVQMGVDLPSTTDSTLVVIKNSLGGVVRTFNIGTGNAGTNAITWDGKDDNNNLVGPGKYTFSVNATVNNNAVTATNLSYGRVTSISMSSTGVKLNTDNLGAVDVSGVRLVQ
jgi:flagellar basal-body rod modification protein FlgD